MARDFNFSQICGVAAYVTCSFCKGKKRLPGGKYRHEGEVVDCPICNGLGAERACLDLDQFAKLVTIAMIKTKSRRRWSPKQTRTTATKRRRT